MLQKLFSFPLYQVASNEAVVHTLILMDGDDRLGGAHVSMNPLLRRNLC